MKPNYLIIVSLILALLLAGCATVSKCPPCPAENTVFMAPSGPVEMPKGFFDTKEGENWMHTDDYEKKLKDMIEKHGGL